MDIRRGSIEAVTPEMFGAIGDGVADDTEAINTAAEAARGYGIPFRFTRDYYVTDSLNFTGTPGGWYGYGVFRGNHGWDIGGTGQYTTNIYADLAEPFPVFDFTGTGRLYFHDIHISGKPGGQQTAGVLLAMDGEHNKGHSPQLERVQIDGEYSKVGLANISADLSEISRCAIFGPIGVCYSETDVLGVGSKYRTFTTLRHQNTQHNIYGGGIQGSESSAILVDTMGGSLVATGSVISLNTTATSAIKTTGDSPGSIYFHGCRTETLSTAENTHLLYAEKSPQYSHFSGAYHCKGVGPLFYIPEGQYFYNSFIQLHTTSSNVLLFGGGGAVRNCIVYNLQGLDAEIGGGTNNVTVYSQQSDPWDNFIVGHVSNTWHSPHETLIGGDVKISRKLFAGGVQK